MENKVYIGKDGRKYTKTNGRPRLFWSTADIDYLKRHYPRTGAYELSEILDYSPMTIKRKAKELGLKKDLEFRKARNLKTLKLACLTSRLYGNKAWFTKGQHVGLATEFKPKYTLVRLDTGFVGTSREIATQIGADQTNIVAAAKRKGTCNGIKIRFYNEKDRTI